MSQDVSSQYSKLTDIEHVLLRPGRYLGSVVDHTAISWLLNESGKFVKREATWNPALLKTFDEIISNSVDEAKRKGSKLDTIKVTINEMIGEISVWDNGGIPVVVHDEHNQWIPEMIFSELRAGSNFDDSVESDITGQNGEGSSLTNIFSKEFCVTTCDGKKTFTQTFFDNLSRKTEPQIGNGKNGFTEIRWIPDYDRFNTHLMKNDNYAKLVKRVHDIAACNANLKVFLNGKRINYKSFKDYVTHYTEEFVYDQNDDWQIAIAHSDDGFQHVSFVNSTETMIGGTHVNYVANQLVDHIRAYILKKHKIDVKPANIKQHISLYVNARIIKPRYSSQTKEDLITEARVFGTEWAPTQNVINQIVNSNIIQSVLDWIASKQRAEELAKLRREQKKLKTKKVAAHIKANSRKTSDRILHLMEGDSALSNFLNVRDQSTHGAYPLRGKPLNVRNCEELSRVAKDKEFSAIMSILGLEFGKKAENLNYGNVRYSTDADLDGAGSIVGLLNNFFAMWPELFDQGVIEILRSPIVIAKKGKSVKRFYKMADYNAEAAKLDGWTIKYAKGLGSLSEAEYDHMINEPVVETVVFDADADKSLEMVFGNSVDARKDWLTN